MTRENKLALVVGFGLILLVGILVSDHFSVERQAESAELTQVVDPLNQRRWDNPNLLVFNEPPPANPPASTPWQRDDSALLSPGVTPIDEQGRPAIQPPVTTHDQPTIGLSPQQVRDLPYEIHRIRSGESLSSICEDFYGDNSLVDELARFNNITNPNRISVGQRLRIPSAHALTPPGSGPPARAEGDGVQMGTPVSPPAATTTYTVQAGDSLSEISQRLLGTSRRYREIFELNRTILRSADDVRVGMELRIPPR